MGFGSIRTGEDASRAGDELLEPGRGFSVDAAERVPDDVASFHTPAGADRRVGNICHP
jgi:hypothetical protein